MKAITIIIIIAILFILYVLIFVRKKDKHENHSFYNYHDVKKKLKTGDIILFSCNSNEDFYSVIKYYIRTKFVGSSYGHVGLVYKDYDDKLYIVECVSSLHCADEHAIYLNNYGKGGVRIIDMEILFDKYSKENSAYFAVKFISKEISNDIFIENLNSYAEKIFENKSILFFLAFVDLCISHNLSNHLTSLCNENKMMCSEFVHNILYRCNVTKEYTSKLIWPFTVMDELFEKLEIVKYSEPIKFIFNQ